MSGAPQTGPVTQSEQTHATSDSTTVGEQSTADIPSHLAQGSETYNTSAAPSDQPHAEEIHCTQYSNGSTPGVLLRVIPVAVSSDGEKWVTTYGLLDSGSTCTMVSRKLAERTEMPVIETKSISINTVIGTGSKQVGLTNCTFASLVDGSELHARKVHITEDLSIDRKYAQVPSALYDHLDGLHREDIEVDLPEVSVLIGEDVPMAHCVLDTKYGPNPHNQPYGVRTPFGWCLAGPVESTFSTSTEDHLQESVDKWWSEERHGFKSDDAMTLSIEDKVAMKILETTTTIEDGHYCAGMLWRESCPRLHNNLSLALKRLRQLKRKFDADNEFADMYTTAMNSLIQKGYMRKISREEETAVSPITWYLPHHGVTNPNKPGKVRPVKDAAATYQGTSLNKALMHGPDLTNSIIGVLMRFRTDRVALVADIAEMFMQVKVPLLDQDALRVLWWGEGLDRPPNTYKMTRHIFGATDSPSVCSYALRRCANDNATEFSEEAIRTVLRNFYVDDLLKSVADPSTAVSLAEELKNLLSRGGFNLTKFMSNSDEVLQRLPDADTITSGIDIAAKDGRHPHRALGVTWLMKPDVFTVKIASDSVEGTPTRRTCTSTISSIYDPIGICGPGTLPAKRILQEACKRNLTWDDPLPEDLSSSWRAWVTDMPLLQQLQIPRCYLDYSIAWSDVTEVQLHHFCDASEIGYGTVSYLRIQAGVNVHLRFLLAKSRCAPKDFVSIPRMELQAATVAARVDRLVRRELCLPVKITKTFFWTDSMIVMGYIRNKDRRYKTYVANRLEEIHDTTQPDQWRYCPTSLNPADIASRGAKVSALVKRKDWICGPEYLEREEEYWPPDSRASIADNDQELKPETPIYVTSEVSTLENFICHYSSLDRLTRGVAYLQRFIEYLQSKNSKNAGRRDFSRPISLHDLRRARTALIGTVQRLAFPKGKETANIASLNPFEDSEDGLIRVGGRLGAAIHLPFESRHPAILPKRHHLTELVIRHYHTVSAHCGQEQTLNDMRKVYYPIHGKSMVRAILRNCVTCRKIKGNLMEQIMADLPKSRTETHEIAFSTCGMDAFGPLTVKRGRRHISKYGLLFVCFSTRCIHLEVLEDMSTDAAMNATRRFIGRRGTPKQICADNGGNQVGMSREMRIALRKWNDLVPELSQRDIEFKFTTPYASHMAGVWERLVKTVRQALQAVLGKGVVSEDMLNTIFAEVEGIVNARPLIPASDDPADLEALTPMHFLIGRNHVALPPGEFSDSDKFSRRWKATQAYINNVWSRWVAAYLPTLQKRTKWIKRKRDIRLGDLVLIAEQNQTRGHWPMARVIKLFPSEDGIVRSVELKTATSILKRPIHNLCLLESSE